MRREVKARLSVEVDGMVEDEVEGGKSWVKERRGLCKIEKDGREGLIVWYWLGNRDVKVLNVQIL